ncbi:MAG TPA: RlmE family RNA methyltransferase [Caulobacterales bacterium]|nr:RlmE family RNA methyltransferase [Caulobacterales bacterium]
MTDEPKRRWRGPDKNEKTDARGEKRLVQKAQIKKNRKASSKQWIERHINDPYVQRAQAEGWRARAAFKLIELDEKFGLFKRGMKVIDLGAAPGGWSQVVLKHGASRVVGVDLLRVDAMAGAIFIEGDLTEEAVGDELMNLLGGKADLVLSDMAANTTGHARTDQIKTGALADAAADFALAHLAPGGAFVTKAFQGGLDASLLTRLKASFTQVRHAKPPASRAESSEIYLVAQGFRGAL